MTVYGRLASGRGPLKGPRSRSPGLSPPDSEPGMGWPFQVIRNKDQFKFLHMKTVCRKDRGAVKEAETPGRAAFLHQMQCRGQVSRYSDPSHCCPSPSAPCGHPRLGLTGCPWSSPPPMTAPRPFSSLYDKPADFASPAVPPLLALSPALCSPARVREPPAPSLSLPAPHCSSLHR